MDYEKSKAEPCLYFVCNMLGLILWVTWVDDCCVLGYEDGVKAAMEQINSIFDCNDIGELTEYVGCKIERTSRYVQFTEPVLLQSYADNFGLDKDRPTRAPAEAGKVLMKCAEGTEFSSAEQTKYRQGVGKLLL
jgi:hypothetical protein